MEVIFFSRYYAGVTELYDAFYASRRIGSYNVTPINFTSTDGRLICVSLHFMFMND